MSDLGRYRKVYTKLWLHPGFLGLSDAEKIVAFYLLTGTQSNRIGLYRLSPAVAAEDLGTSLEAFRKRLARVCTSLGWLFDSKLRVFYMPSFLRWNPPVNKNVARGITNDLNDVPMCAFVEAFAKNLEGIPGAFVEDFIEGLQQHWPHGVSNQDQEQDLETRNRKPNALRAEEGIERKGAKASDLPKDDRLVSIAHETLKLISPNATIEDQIDSFHHVARQQHIEARRADIVSALAAALSQQRTA